MRLIDSTTGETIGGSVMSLFSETGEFHHGAKDICLWPGREPDPTYYGSGTPAIGKQDSRRGINIPLQYLILRFFVAKILPQEAIKCLVCSL